jgi:CelD/BcsL family acetyltransferase involved in cellulose biosynthesis
MADWMRIWHRSLSKSRLKDLKRNLRRLGEQGSVAFERAVAPALIDERLEQFLALEASGWKGKARTAFLSKEKHAAFARRAFGGSAHTAGRLAIDSLLLDGRPLAISLNIVGGENIAFTPKCAFDEHWRSYSPGLLLEYFVIQAFYEQKAFAAMDSATTMEGHVIAGLWKRRRRNGRPDHPE